MPNINLKKKNISGDWITSLSQKELKTKFAMWSTEIKFLEVTIVLLCFMDMYKKIYVRGSNEIHTFFV